MPDTRDIRLVLMGRLTGSLLNLRGVGWPGASTWSPSEDLPPKWLVDAGEEVLAFGRARQRSPGPTLTRLRSIQKRLADYAVQARATLANKTMEPTR